MPQLIYIRADVLRVPKKAGGGRRHPRGGRGARERGEGTETRSQAKRWVKRRKQRRRGLRGGARGRRRCKRGNTRGGGQNTGCRRRGRSGWSGKAPERGASSRRKDSKKMAPQISPRRRAALPLGRRVRGPHGPGRQGVQRVRSVKFNGRTKFRVEQEPLIKGGGVPSQTDRVRVGKIPLKKDRMKPRRDVGKDGGPRGTLMESASGRGSPRPSTRTRRGE